VTSPEHHQILRVIDDGVELNVSVVPRSSRCEIAGIHNNVLRIKLTSPPVDNEANVQCCSFIAKQLGIAKRQVSIIRGTTARSKTIRIEGVTEKEVREVLINQTKDNRQPTTD
jgi:uncharacterized protein (TIGR00251 family)